MQRHFSRYIDACNTRKCFVWCVRITMYAQYISVVIQIDVAHSDLDASPLKRNEKTQTKARVFFFLKKNIVFIYTDIKKILSSYMYI